ncbi:zinc finger protein 62 homolog [Argopecten irradians]|uniref:zinc finger protein 62 homolog n=1 Tax=Argopecten irradians TaxID=31199 RepID=UPI003724B089
MESGSGCAEMDLSKIYNESLNFLIQERQKLQGMSKSPVTTENKIGSTDSFMNGRSCSPIGHALESAQFKNDVMFSSGSMSECSAEGYAMSGNDSKITAQSLINSSDSMVFSERFGQNVSTDLLVNDIKKEPVSDEEEAVGTYYQTSSQTVFPGMMASSVKTETDLDIHSENSQDTVSYVIKQEPLTDEDDVIENDTGNDVFSEYLLKGNDINDESNNDIVQQSEQNPKRHRNIDETAPPSKRRRRKATKKLYNKFGDEFNIDEGDERDEDYVPSDHDGVSEEEYTPYNYSNEKVKNTVREDTEIGEKSQFVFENLEGNLLSIKGTSKNLQVKIFKCQQCKDIFTYESVFKKHMKKHTGDLPFNCKHCKLGFNTQFSHDIHSRVHRSDKMYLCSICGEKLKIKKELKDHITNHMLTKKAQEISLTLPASYQPLDASGDSFKSDIGLSPFGCSMCIFVAKDFAEIGNHVMDAHFVDKRCFCDICSRRFSNTDDLKFHKALHDGQCEEISCGICEEIVDSKEDLMKHLDIHPEAKPYRCCHCGEKFIVLTQLRNHMQSHSFTKRYNCPHCLKQFFHETTLKSHLRVHTGEISYTCPVCEKGFWTVDRLRIHMRQHSVPYSLSANYETKVVEDVGNSGDAANAGDSGDAGHGDACNSTQQETPKSDNGSDENGTDGQDSDRSTLIESNTETGTVDSTEKDDNTVEKSSSISCLEQLLRQPIKKRNGIEMQTGQNPDAVLTNVENNQNIGGNVDGHVDESNDPVVFDALKSTGAPTTGTPISIPVKRLTKVPIPNSSNETWQSVKRSNTGLRFTEVADTMNLQLNIHQCHICGDMFAYNNVLKKHIMMKHAGIQLYKCDICGHGCQSASALNAHRRIHSGEKPFMCDKCPKTFRQKSGLRSHTLTHTTERTFECRHCLKVFKDLTLFQQHRRGPCDADAFGCNVCNITFGDMKIAISHVKTSHFFGKTHVCTLCCLRFDTMNRLEKHETTHVDSKSYTCGICGHDFKDKDDLCTHLNGHSIASPFQCQICITNYRTEISFSSHMDSHLSDGSILDTTSTPPSNKTLTPSKAGKKGKQTSKEQTDKQFKCKFCDKVFPSAGQRWTHSAMHAKARPYSCSICGKRYINKGSLSSHEESHNKDKEMTPKSRSDKSKKGDDTIDQDQSQNKSPSDALEHDKDKQTSSGVSRPKKRNKKNNFSLESFVSAIKEKTQLSLGTESQETDDNLSEQATMKEHYACENSTEAVSDIDNSFIKTEPISDGYVDMETDAGRETEPMSAAYSDTQMDIGESDQSLQDRESHEAFSTASAEIKTEPDDDACDATPVVYACSVCEETFVNQEKLDNHEQSHYTPEPVELICTECGADFWKKSDLHKHIRKHHNETKKPSFKSKLKKIKMRDSTLPNT